MFGEIGISISMAVLSKTKLPRTSARRFRAGQCSCKLNFSRAHGRFEVPGNRAQGRETLLTTGLANVTTLTATSTLIVPKFKPHQKVRKNAGPSCRVSQKSRRWRNVGENPKHGLIQIRPIWWV